MSNNRVDVHVGARTSELERGMENAQDIVKNTSDSIERAGRNTNFEIDVSGVEQSFENLSTNISNQMLELGKNIVAGLVSTLAIDGLIDLTTQAISTASEIQKMSDLVGDSVEDFQYFAAGAATAGLSLEQFGNTGKDALEKLGEGKTQEGEMMDFFNNIAPKVGLTIDSFKELSGPEVLQKYYNGLEKANLSHDETIRYMEQLVSDSSLLIPLLKDGGAGFEQWGEAAKNAGATMSQGMVDNLGVVEQSLAKLQLQFQGFQVLLVNAITPVVTSIAKNFDTVKAVVVALGVAITTKLVIQMGLLSIEFIKGVAEGIRYQMTLAAMAGQTITLTTATAGLRVAMLGLVGGTGGLAILALQAIAAGAAFFYMKKGSDEVEPSLQTQGKTIAELRIEYEKLDQAQQRIAKRQATTELDKATEAYEKQKIALFGLVRAVYSHGDASEEDKQKTKDLYQQYLSGNITTDQLSTAINNLKTVSDKHKTSIDEKASALAKESKNIATAEGVLKTYNSTTKQSTEDNKENTKSIDAKAEALKNLTAKQLEYVQASKTEDKREAYTTMLEGKGFSRDKAESYADSKEKSGTDYYAPMPEAVKASAEADWKRTQATKLREESEKKTDEKLKEQTKQLEKQQKILQVNAAVKANAQKYNYASFEKQYSLPSGMLSAVNMQETRGRNVEGVQTKYGTAKGNFQMLDGTAKRFGVTNPFDTKQAAEGAAKYLQFLLKKFGDIDKAISAYHAGEGNVEKGTGIGPINRQYVKNVKGYMAGANGVEQGTDASAYEKSLQDQVSKAGEAEKQRLALKYKYASEQEKIAIDLKDALADIDKSTLSGDEKINAIVQVEKEASDKTKAIRIDQLEQSKDLLEQELQGKVILAQRIYELEMVQLQASFDAGKISNVEKITNEKQVQDKLYELKRQGLEDRLTLEMELGALTGDTKGATAATNNLGDLKHQKSISDTQSPALISSAEMADFDAKFGGFTSRISGLWDSAMQSMMNGTLTWRNATNAVLTDMASFAIGLATKELQDWMKIQAVRLAKHLGLIGASTTATVSGEAAKTGAVATGEGMRLGIVSVASMKKLMIESGAAIKKIMMSAYEAMAGAWAAMASIPYIGPALGVAAGIAAFAGVSAIVGKVASARGGYDIPAGVNPMTQLHEEEMVLPKQHANTIRALGRQMTNGGMSDQPVYTSDMGMMPSINIQAWDSKDIKRFMKKNGRALAGGLKGYNRNFGK